ncbi:hypothetical protein GEMRC1_008606 [Eukaryota sp. GEM-RC1]
MLMEIEQLYQTVLSNFNGKSQFTFSPFQNVVYRVTVVAPGYAYWMSPSFSLKETVSFDAELNFTEALAFWYCDSSRYNHVALGVGSSDWTDSSSLQSFFSGSTTCRAGRMWPNCQSTSFTSSECLSHFNVLSFLMYPASADALTKNSVTLEIGADPARYMRGI